MTDLTIRDVFDLPATIPPCIVMIQDFDDEATLQQNVRDYVITDTVAEEMTRLVARIVASSVRHEAGAGHYLHGSFGSGKSHFMAILGLILENNPAVWAKEHLAIRQIQAQHGAWLAEHPILVVPVYMLGQESLQAACYNAANQRMAQLGAPPADFSDAGKIIAGFRADAERYGAVVFERFQASTGISARRFEQLAAGSQPERDDLAQKILAEREVSRTERRSLYPDKFSDGMAQLTRHAQAHGFAGVVFLIDELILYLTGKGGREYVDEFNDLVALADNSALDRAAPLWVIVARQRDIHDIVPDDTSQLHVSELMEHHKDRFPEQTNLADTELTPIVEQRVLRVRPGMEARLRQTVADTLAGLDDAVRATLLHDQTPEDFRRVYPFHPALIRTLIDVSARLSRERAAIRLLYELLIERHADMALGDLVPYAALFDVVFLPEALTGGSRHEELEAVRQTYYTRLAPIIADHYTGEQAERARLVVKTVLLCGMSKTMRGDITVGRILHLNYQDLRGRTAFGSYQAIARILTDLDNRSELVHFTANTTDPALGVADITLASGVQLSDVLKRVPLNWNQKLAAFHDLMRDLLGQPLHNGEIANYERVWRGTRRRGRVRFVNVAELSTNDMLIRPGDEFTLFVDYPFDLSQVYNRADDLKTIERARATFKPVAIGFWLPEAFASEDVRDLDEYAKMVELEGNASQYLTEYGKTQQEDILSKLAGQRRTKAITLRQRLEQIYKGPHTVVSFLDPAITPSLDVQSLSGALERIADTVCERRYPHHPRFPSELNRRTLERLLEDFLVKAALGGGAVPRNSDLDGILSRLGEPLELAECGAHNWTLRPQSRYLTRLEELATGKRVQVDTILDGLSDAFGFSRELSETFILYLIRGRGYRALRGEQPVAKVDYGQVSGLVLERGQRLVAHEWAQVKNVSQSVWHVQVPATELTVAAQDQLWRQLNAAARNTRPELQQARRKLGDVLHNAGVASEAAPRVAILEAALALNELATREDLDSFEGLRVLLNWQPTMSAGTEVARDAVELQIDRRGQTLRALEALHPATLERIARLAEGDNVEARESLETLRTFLAAPESEADLYSHILSWQTQANAVIDHALVSKPEPQPDVGKRKPNETDVCDKLGATQLYLAEGQLEIEDQTFPLDAPALDTIKTLLNRLGIAPSKAARALFIRLTLAEKQE